MLLSSRPLMMSCEGCLQEGRGKSAVRGEIITFRDQLLLAYDFGTEAEAEEVQDSEIK